MVRAQGLMALAVGLLVAGAPALAGPAVVTCPRLATAPAVDGVLAPGEWSQAAALGPFALLRSAGMPSLTTQAWVGYTADGVYVGARLADPSPMQIHCFATERDGAVANDDSFHLLLDTDRTGTSVIHMAVNAAGTRYDALGADAGVDFNWEAVTGLTANGWVVELMAHFESNAARDGDTWRMTCYRNAPRVSEKSAWSELQRGVLEPANFGELVFGGPAVRCEVGPIAVPWFGDNELPVAVQNSSDEAMQCKVNTRVTGTDRRAHSFRVSKLTVAAGSRSQAQVPFTVQRGGPGAVEVSVQVIEGDTAITVLRTVPMPFALPALGQALDEALGAIVQAYKVYVTMPEQSRPEDGNVELESLLARWRYLESQHAERESLGVQQMQALIDRAQALQEDTEEFTAQLRAACPAP